MPRNPELDHEYREDKPKEDAQKRAAHASLFYMEMPDGNPLMNEPDPVDPERMAALRRTSKKPWRIVGGALIVAAALLVVWGILYLAEVLRLAGCFIRFSDNITTPCI